MKKLMVIALTLMVMLCFGAISFAGNLDDTGLPTSPSSAMFTLEDIYYRLDTGAAGAKRSGAFVEPSSGPTAGTGHTLDEVMGLAPTVDDTNGAVPAEILSGKTFWGLTIGNWGLKTGTMTNNVAVTYTPTTTNQTVAEGYHNGSGVVSGDTDLVTTNIRSGINIFGVAGDSNVVNTSSGDAGSGDILNGKKAWIDGSEVTGSLTCPPAPTGNAVVGDVLSGKTFSNLGGTGLTGTMTNNGAVNYTPGTTNQTIAEGYYNGSGHVAGDADLLAGNIKADTEIFGVTGTFPNDGTAATGDVKSGSTFYTNSAAKLTGTGTKTLSSANDTVSAGYYEATTLSAVDADLVEANIKKDVNIFGKVGTYTGCTCSGTITGTRWCDNGDGTVTDLTTCLVWLKDASAGGSYALWVDTAEGTSAHDRAAQFKDGVGGLTDGSVEGDWRLPTKTELYNLANGDEAVRSSDMRAFTDVQFSYRSSSTCEVFIARSWIVYMETGEAGRYAKVATHLNYVWPVRSGN